MDIMFDYDYENDKWFIYFFPYANEKWHVKMETEDLFHDMNFTCPLINVEETKEPD